MTTVYYFIPAVVVGVLAALPGWIALRKARSLEQERDALLEAIRRRQPIRDGDDDDGRPRRHLWIVSLWLPLAAGLAWLIAQLRRPVVGSVVGLTATATVVTGLWLAIPRDAGDGIAVPPAVSRTRRPPQPPIRPPSRPPRHPGAPGASPSSSTATSRPGRTRQTLATPTRPASRARPPVPSTMLPPTTTTTPAASTTMSTTAPPAATTRRHRRPRCIIVRLRPIVIHLSPPACLSPP